MRRSNPLSMVLVLAAGALAGGVVSGCGENPVPVNPTYSQHIKPLMTAHCIRCHGAGGMQNKDPDIPPDFNPDAGPPFGVLMIGGKTTGPNGDFTNYTTLAGYATPGNPFMKLYLPYMPPPPSDPLSGWELDLLNAWLAHPLP